METIIRCVKLRIADGRPSTLEPPHGLMLAGGMAMDADLRAVHELLEHLDDAMFAAIDGDEAAGKRARELWQCAKTSLRDELLEESREHYLSFASEVLRRTGANGVREAERSLAVSEIIAMLTT
jgi:hypothetical protein